MSYSRQGSVGEQMRFLRRQFLQDGGLPFTDILSEELVSQALKAIDGYLDRIYSPLVVHAVGFSGAGVECGPVLPRRGRPLDCASYFAETEALFCRDRRLLPGQKAAA